MVSACEHAQHTLRTRRARRVGPPDALPLSPSPSRALPPSLTHLVLVAPALALVPELKLRDDLVGERARHDKARVARRAAQVKQAALGEQDDAVAVGEDEAVALRLDVLALDARPRVQAWCLGWVGGEVGGW